jgi:hypothetical protein
MFHVMIHDDLECFETSQLWNFIFIFSFLSKTHFETTSMEALTGPIRIFHPSLGHVTHVTRLEQS